MAEEPFNTTEASEHVDQAASGFQQTADDLKSAANAKFNDLKSAATAKGEEIRTAANAKAEELRGKAEEAWGDAKVRARSLQEDGEAYVRENPTRTIVGAVAAGFLLGVILRK